MNIENLKKITERLTGKDVNISESDKELLRKVFSVKNPVFGWNEFNEILLICNKDRVEEGFFDFFFRDDKKKSEKLTLKEIAEGVENFRKYAALAYGNIIFPYRELSKLSIEEIKKRLGKIVQEPSERIRSFKSRTSRLPKIERIRKENTYFLGYLSSKSITLDMQTVIEIQGACESFNKLKNKQRFCQYILRYVKKNVQKSDKLKDNEKKNVIDFTEEILTIYFKNNPRINIKEFNKFINESLINISVLADKLAKAREIGRTNTNIYLIWDYIDVYFATSMRKKWEFETLYDLISSLFKDKKLSSLKLRYFDPTQSYEKCPIDKGLIEGLMLKRAKCTIYSSQEMDTLGKDSELAITLAQGKPVIAFVPEININKHKIGLEQQPLDFFIDKTTHEKNFTVVCSTKKLHPQLIYIIKKVMSPKNK